MRQTGVVFTVFYHFRIRLRQAVREEKEKFSQLPPDQKLPQTSVNVPRKEGDAQSLTDQVLELHADITTK